MTFRLLILLAATLALSAQVTFDRLVQADREPHNWLTYSGTYRGHRYSPLHRITRDNVTNLRIEW
jgi:alcohol dehydrogenase (cytochrome c)